MKRLPYELNLALVDELGKPVTFNGAEKFFIAGIFLFYIFSV